MFFCRLPFFFVPFFLNFRAVFRPFRPVGHPAGASEKHTSPEAKHQNYVVRDAVVDLLGKIFRPTRLNFPDQLNLFFVVFLVFVLVPRWCSSIIVLVHQASQIVKPPFRGKTQIGSFATESGIDSCVFLPAPFFFFVMLSLGFFRHLKQG